MKSSNGNNGDIRKYSDIELEELAKTIKEQYDLATEPIKARFRNTFQYVERPDICTFELLKKAVFIEKYEDNTAIKKTRERAVSELTSVIQALFNNATPKQKQKYYDIISKCLDSIKHEHDIHDPK